MTAPARIDTDNWPTLEEAAVTLKTSVRTMWRHIERGDVEARKRPVPGRKPANVVNPLDLDKLRPRPYVMPDAKLPPTAIAPAVQNSGTIDEIAVALQRLVAAVVPIPPASQLAVPIDRKLWLTVDEASAYSGFARGKLRAAIADDRLASRPDGPRGATVINRADLERFCSL